jgi:hypothetical protein
MIKGHIKPQPVSQEQSSCRAIPGTQTACAALQGSPATAGYPQPTDSTCQGRTAGSATRTCVQQQTSTVTVGNHALCISRSLCLCTCGRPGLSDFTVCGLFESSSQALNQPWSTTFQRLPAGHTNADQLNEAANDGDLVLQGASTVQV